MIFSSLARQHIIDEMTSREYDLLIIGGGITGAGIALDAAARGIDTALVEMNDFSSGTSSRSTKLIHGGLRYLQQGEIKEVAELGRERAIVYNNGPHITTPIWMMLPFHRGGTFGRWTTSLGLTMYDSLARVKKEERKKMLSPEATLEIEPLLKKEGLLGAGKYVEYRTDDARLTIEVLKTAAQNGADIINYVQAESFEYNHDGKIAGVHVKNRLSGKISKVKARIVVNAAGPWVDAVRAADRTGSNKEKHLKLSKGVHIVIDQTKFPLRHAVYFDAPDGRLIFAIPRDGKAYVGTTDTFYTGDPSTPKADKEDRDYLLGCIKHYFPDVQLTIDDIESSWAGVRPLIYEEGKASVEISRKDEIWESQTGLITIAGGKLTGYRKMAEKVVSLVVKRLLTMRRGAFARCTTKECVLSGGEVGDADQFLQFINHHAKKAATFGLTEQEGRYLASKYGSNVGVLFNWSLDAEPSADRLLFAELMYAMNDEMAVTPSDFFIRRTGDLYFNIQRVKRCMFEAINLMSETLSWSTEQQRTYEHELDIYIKQAILPEDF
ncbi:glycerol-3-phosphate dehydrogenase/oxidase [Siminovitchia acidinfaciens]|uniref:Glycerol-3-phosphate dehydrogenase n=1 Tax=Siminovitchia acidinfaciens TaxID=2321395 RepID=A0A429XTX4_9BACI|nr:glycerol-3-phosphate dehydrogenase/oxidase [Siminovitchia acidinfaciens]RST71292.1 glycerol-3-phosphate dehydrogenase/oxidase [Siminovitchia acidinfaciens]